MSLTMTMEHEQHQEHGFGYHDGGSHWVEANSAFSSQHQSPVHEHNGFQFTPMPMESMYSSSMPPPRSTYQSLQPLITPQWPSQLTSQSTYNTPIYSSPPLPSAPISTPVSAPPTSGRSSSTPRKTLTDQDRRRMCIYADEHPNVKQTEIGAMFGVERSTVSKVLRNKEKYLFQDQGDRSPARKPKGKFPDIERALSNWAKNHQKQGLPMSDALIKEKLRFFSLSVGSGDSHVKAYSSSWLEKFKQKNNLMGAKSRKNSVAEESEGASNPGSGAQTPNISPTSPPPGKEPSPARTDANKGDDQRGSVKLESPELSQTDFFGHKPYHSLSNASLASAFNEGASFSPGPQSPTSPFFSADSASPFIPQGSQQGSRVPSASAPNSAYPSQRPRSQTFPMLGIEPGSYVSPPSSEPLTPKFSGATVLDDMNSAVLRSVEELHEHVMPTSTMQPPPPPAISSTLPMAHRQHSSPITPSSAISSQLGHSPSIEDTRRAMEIVMTFFQSQPSGIQMEPQEYMMMGKLMEKLKLQPHPQHHHIPVSTGGEMPGGMHRIPSTEFGFLGKD